MIFLILSSLTIFILGYILVLKRKPSDFIKSKSAILFVTAHPDDECMFFGPAILNLLKKNCEVHLLCMSSGSYRNESVIRKQELRKSCQVFGIPPGNVIIIEHSHLPDNPKRKWNKVKVGSIILKYCLTLSINNIISFDEGGVSGHSNHVAICDSLKYLHSKHLIPIDCDIYLLKSVSIFQKYFAFLFVFLTYLCEKFCFVSNFEDVRITQKCMRIHQSQYIWFRKLYIVFSKYVYMNAFKKL